MPTQKRKSKSINNPEHLRPRQDDSFNVVIETPRGSHNKYKWDDDLGAYTLAKVLPAGMSFPFDFGFIPRTKAEDGDAIGGVVLGEAAAFPGWVVACRLIGTIEARQTEGKKTERNDRLIGVAQRS